MPDPKYKELETTDDVQDGYEAQNTIEDKFYYLLNYSARNALIRQSADFLSEKERLSMGMKPAQFTNTKNFDMEKACSKFQNNTEMLVEQTHYFRIQREFFQKDEKKNVTIDGCKRFFESMGSLNVKPLVDMGKRYDEMSQLIPNEEYAPQDMDYKTKFLMRYGLPKESAIVDAMDTTTLNINNVICVNQQFTSVDTLKQRSMGLKPYKTITDELKKNYDKSLGEVLDLMQVNDKEERDRIIKYTGCTAESTLDDALKASEKSNVAFERNLVGHITKAWKNQGLKKTLGTLSEKDLLAYKRGREATELKDDKKYKTWIKEQGRELVAELQHKEYKAAFKDINKIIHTKKNIGVPVPKEGKNVSLADIDKIKTGSTIDRRREPAEVDKQAKKDHLSQYEASVRYKAYVESNTGKISQNKEKNLEKLLKNMAALILSDSKHVKSFSTDLIDKTAEKISKSLNLNELGDDEIRTALKSPKQVNDLFGKQMNNLFAPSDVHGLISSMEDLGKDMMSKADRSPEYQNLVNAVVKMGRINSDKANTPEAKKASIKGGFEVMLAAENYMKGKKSVRSSEDGKERFDNALDALGMLYKNVPGLRPHIKEIVDRINHVRKAEDPNHKDHVDIEKYGSERAREAKMNRALKDQGVKPAKQAMVR